MKVCVWDLDNTIVDTNSVWANAQTKLLSSLFSYIGLETSGVKIDEELLQLRRIDYKLCQEFGTPHYDFKYLLIALFYFYRDGIKGDELIEVTRKADQDSIPEFTKILLKDFYKNLDKIPPLFDGILDVLKFCNKRSYQLLISEGSKEVKEKIIKKYELPKYFNEIRVIPKGGKENEFKGLRKRYPNLDIIVFDDLSKNIDFGNQIHAKTVWVRFCYTINGYDIFGEKPKTRPDYTVFSVKELMRVVKSFLKL